MNPDASRLWRAPRWALSVLLACLAMVGPFSIDTYLPAFAGIGAALNATPVEMQQTLSAYLFGFAFMNLFHGALSDCFGRRPVVLIGLAAFTVASIGCALSGSIGHLVFWRTVQGMSAGAGIVVSRAIIRDMFPPADAQRIMSQVTLFFGVAPAIAPMVGGFLFKVADWHSIFWFLTAVGAALLVSNWRLLPETLHANMRQPFHVGTLMREYRRLCSSPKFMMLVLASGIPFNGMFLYVLAAPVFLGEHLHFEATQFFWLFLCTIGGIMVGAAVSGRLAGKMSPKRQIMRGFRIMVAVSVVNVVLNLFVPLSAFWALPLIGLFSFGWALMVPVVTLLVLDQVPERRGMASSLQASIGSAANGLVAGVLVPMVMHSTVALAVTSAGLMLIGLVSWYGVRRSIAA
ncbi:multidrug effflux MFS transporter [Roseateles sp. NT4]|uniref:multidrug effflux MFS transporter n=1 Tax=Roseateles sp. NT4 TaxID=3453715 RepID=UPI003EEAF9F3